MKKITKIVLITVLVAFPALGTYVKTALPHIGSAPDLAMERTAKPIEAGQCQVGGMAVSIHCNNNRNWSELADPIMGGLPNPDAEPSHDFPVNFLFKTIPFQEEKTDQNNVAAKKTGKYFTAAML